MKIKRFFAKEMRQAMRMVREEQGPDAVILSARSVEGGHEVIAAIDYDEEFVERAARNEPPRVAPGHAAPPPPATVPAAKAAPTDSRDRLIGALRSELERLRGAVTMPQGKGLLGGAVEQHPNRVELLRRLRRIGIQNDIASALVAQPLSRSDLSGQWRETAGRLAAGLPILDDTLLDEGGVAALIGPTGVGKTTTIAKFAARFALRHGTREVALISMDSYRVGAHDQLRHFGERIGVPVFTASGGAELRALVDRLASRRLVLIDNAGLGQHDDRLAQQFATLAAIPGLRTYLALAANTQLRSLEDAMRVFGAARPTGTVLTKVDEAGSLGEAISVVMRHQLPVAYLCDGQRVPEDMQPARAERLVTNAVQLVRREAAAPAVAPMARFDQLAVSGYA